MKQRSPVGLVILTVLTFGLYSLSWFNGYKQALEDNTTERVPTIWWLPAPIGLYFFGIVALITGLTGGSSQTLIIQNCSTNQSCIANTAGSSIGHPGLFLFGMALILLGLMYSLTFNLYWYYQFAKGVNQYTGGRLKIVSTVVWLWLCLPVGMALVQDGINQTLGGVSKPAGPLPTPPKDAPPPPSAPPPNAPPKEMIVG